MEVTKKICKFYLDKKKRYCKFEVYKNAEFCFHHHTDEEQFMPCPIDPNHTVLKSKLEKHLQICPKVQYKRQLEQSVWYQENVNVPKSATLNESGLSLGETAEAPEEEDETCKKKSKHFIQEMAQKQPEQYMKLIEKIPEALHKALELYKESIMKQENISGIDVDTLCSEEYLLDMKGHIKVVDSSLSDTQKNIKQCDDLVEGLNRFGLLQKDVCYIEYGAGKGQLSHHIALAVKDCTNILIEMEGRRHKMDKNHRDNGTFYRVRANIKDFDINKVPLIFKKTEPEAQAQADKNQEESKEAVTPEQKVVGVSKHMCGLASDLTFYSILNAVHPVIPFGFMIATCCHHRCTQDFYMNQDFLDKVGLTPEMKKPYFHTSSWGIYRENLEKCVPKDKTKEKEEDPTKLDSDTKTLLGLQVKRTLDIGRVLCLRERGFNCYLIKYCEKVYSPENMIIVGRKAGI